MNCIVAVIIAILALVIHIANAFFQEKSKICSKILLRGVREGRVQFLTFDVIWRGIAV